MSCSVYLDRDSFLSGEPIYITLTNLGSEPLRIGSWQVIDANGRITYSVEPPQIMIAPGSSFVVVWFQVNNDGKPIGRGRYRIVWRPIINDEVIECLSGFFEIL